MRFVISEIMDLTQPDQAHDLEHAIKVYNHGIKALEAHQEELTYQQQEEVLVACLVHDLDDHKVNNYRPCDYRDKTNLVTNEDTWLEVFFSHYTGSADKRIVETMVDLVSCSKWGDTKNPVPIHYLIPRYCDRLEAMGEVGIDRALSYGNSICRPLHDDKTIRVKSKEDFELAAPHSRYLKYTRGMSGKTTLDHFYDKVLHLSVPSWMNNKYLQEESEKRRTVVREWVLEYWRKAE